MFAYTFLIFSLIYITRCENGKLPSYIKPCNYKAADFQDCVRKEIEAVLPKFSKGIPELNITSLEPMHLTDIHVDGNGLKLSFSDADLHGLSGSKLTNFAVDLSKGKEKFSLSFKTDANLTSQYVADGRILILPIKGNGAALVQVKGIAVKIDSDLIINKEDNELHLKLATPKYKYTIDKTIFTLKNLFNGNKQLSKATHMFANENWQQLMDELSPPVVKQIVKQVLKVINKFFELVNLNEMILGYE